jgi:hypothetical protein
MAKENNTLLIIAVIAVIVAVAALLITYSNQYALSRILLSPTGTGTTSVNIASKADISFIADSINWGSGAVLLGQGSDTLNTDQSNVAPDVSTKGYWNRNPNLPVAGDGGDGRTNGLVVRNDGNAAVSLSLYSDKLAMGFIGGGTGTIPDPEFGFKVRNNETSSCTGGTYGWGTDWESFSLSGNPKSICNNLASSDIMDEVEIHIHILIPEDASSGDKIATITGTAVAV